KPTTNHRLPTTNNPLLTCNFISLSRMKLIDIVLLSLAAGFAIIGIYEAMKFGFGEAYWAVMLSLGLFFFYNYRKKKK
ncbi:MAG: hypothetical protein ACKO1F_07760, partial [Flammeovirgaceae bacterium]